jgi:hypothetical protein
MLTIFSRIFNNLRSRSESFDSGPGPSHNQIVGSSDFLFATPSVLSGVSRTLDLGATFDSYNESASEALADTRALLADWAAVGNSLTNAAAYTSALVKAAECAENSLTVSAADLISSATDDLVKSLK